MSGYLFESPEWKESDDLRVTNGAEVAGSHFLEPGIVWSVEFFVHSSPAATPRMKASGMMACEDCRKLNHRKARQCGRCQSDNMAATARVYDPGTADDWKLWVKDEASHHAPDSPILGPVRVDGVWYMKRPQRLMRKKDPDGPVFCITTPDRDNLDKAVLDALKTSGMWRDDAQVCDGRLQKLYHAKQGSPGLWLRISELEVGGFLES